MTAPQPLSARNQPPAKTTAPAARPQPRPAQTPATLQDMLCTWVPGTTSVVRLRITAERGREHILEVTSTHLGRIFGKEVVHDLYLKGRARVKVTPQQLALLT